jgi:hypothetical protein
MFNRLSSVVEVTTGCALIAGSTVVVKLDELQDRIDQYKYENRKYSTTEDILNKHPHIAGTRRSR